MDLGLFDSLMLCIPTGLAAAADAFGMDFLEPVDVDGIGQGKRGAQIVVALGLYLANFEGDKGGPLAGGALAIEFDTALAGHRAE